MPMLRSPLQQTAPHCDTQDTATTEQRAAAAELRCQLALLGGRLHHRAGCSREALGRPGVLRSSHNIPMDRFPLLTTRNTVVKGLLKIDQVGLGADPGGAREEHQRKGGRGPQEGGAVVLSYMQHLGSLGPHALVFL